MWVKLMLIAIYKLNRLSLMDRARLILRVMLTCFVKQVHVSQSNRSIFDLLVNLTLSPAAQRDAHRRFSVLNVNP